VDVFKAYNNSFWISTIESFSAELGLKGLARHAPAQQGDARTLPTPAANDAVGITATRVG